MYQFVEFERENADLFLKWNEGKDADFLTQWAGNGFIYPITKEQIIEDAVRCRAVYMIYYKKDIIGTIALIRMNEQTGEGYIGHYLLDPQMTGKGHGTKVMHNFIRYCFGVLKLKELSLRVYTFNTPALCCYKSNNFVEMERSQLNNGWEVLLMTCKKEKEASSDSTKIIICDETEEDYFETELMTQRAFWNLHVPGCNEHLMVSKLRKSNDYIKGISKIAKLNGHVVGTIMYSKAYIIDLDEKKHDIITFGPLCVEPDYQSLGIGRKLLKATLNEAREEGYLAVLIYGEPGYYPKFGFKTCDHFGITTPDGSNFDAFMGYELIPNALKDITGKFYEAEVMGDLPEEETQEFNKKFPTLTEFRLPGQWE